MRLLNQILSFGSGLTFVCFQNNKSRESENVFIFIISSIHISLIQKKRNK